MRFRNWLLTGSSLTLLTMTPFGAFAQDSARPVELPQACIDAGFTNFEECITALSADPNATAAPPAEAPAEPPAEAPPVEIPVEIPPVEAPPVEIPVEIPPAEVIPEAPPVVPAPVELPPVVEQIAPELKPLPEVVLEAPAPEAVPEAPAVEAAPQAEQAPVAPVQQQAPAEQPTQAAPPVPAERPVQAEQPVEIIKTLPQGITQEQVAPVFDSAKEPEVAAPGMVAAPISVVDTGPAPTTDMGAQSLTIQELNAQPLASVTADQGTAFSAPDTTTASQTIVNNYITNISNINNTTNNNTTNNKQNNIAQQNNITIIEAPVTRLSAGDAITQVILQVGTQLIVNTIGQDTDRFYDARQDEIFYENLSNGRTRETISRPDGSQIITVRNRNGDILRRSRIDPNGREYMLAYFDDRYDNDLIGWRDPGLDLPPLRLNISVHDYVLDAEYADEDQVEIFFRQPPVEQIARLYSIDEVKRSARVRDSVRRLEVGGLTFDTGAATIDRDQVGALSTVANAMLARLAQNPGETFLIEGHTDAVGSEISNLQLSDLRAATVARILTDFYGVPPENLATQGYGERYLKIRTGLGERENRRVTIRRITPLITVANN